MTEQPNQRPPRREFKIERYAYYGLRAMTRILTAPVTWLPESAFKTKTRLLVLNIQHSLTTELAVNKGDTVVQVGTPWPRTLHRFRRALGKNGKLIIIEAEPGNFQRLTEAAADYNNVYLIEGAAWSESKSGQLSLSLYRGDHKISQDTVAMDNDLRPGNEKMKTIDVQFYSIDDVFKNLGFDTLDYLSVTVNGAEYEVLKGASETLKRSPRARVYAKGHAKLESGDFLHTVLEKFMKSIGFNTKITRGEPSSTTDSTWLWRSGDLYAWKTPDSD